MIPTGPAAPTGPVARSAADRPARGPAADVAVEANGSGGSGARRVDTLTRPAATRPATADADATRDATGAGDAADVRPAVAVATAPAVEAEPTADAPAHAAPASEPATDDTAPSRAGSAPDPAPASPPPPRWVRSATADGAAATGPVIGGPKLAALPVVSRRRLLTPPPSPPFEEAEAPFRWQVSLPSSLGRTVMVRVGDGELDLGGTIVSVDEIADARFSLDVEAALLRQAASARMSVTLALTSGATVRMSARNAASSRRAAAIVETLTYLWTLLGDSAGADERQVLVGKIDRGSEVVVGRLRLTSIGIAWKREPIARWSTIGTPRREGLDVVIPRSDAEPIVVPLTADDAYQLPALVPVLRARFGDGKATGPATG